jgi:NTE family protein
MTTMSDAAHARNHARNGAGRRTVLTLQGGGALGSYQAGVYEALAEGGFTPSWIAGVSIGAINASLIAGNRPEDRVDRLRTFWNRITSPGAPFLSLPAWRTGWEGTWGGPRLIEMEQQLGAAQAALFGQPGFFHPRSPADWLGMETPVSFYDTAALRSTLEALVDFDLINAGGTRLSVGAVEVESGNMVYFDNTMMRIGPEHIMASGALPPGFPAVEIGGKAFWDGGLVSNTPLQYVLAEWPRPSSLIFQVDLFPACGRLPRNLDEVEERAKDIRYSSRTRTGTQDVAERQNLRRRLLNFLERLPPDLAADPAVSDLRAFATSSEIDVAHLIYRPDTPQGGQKDYQFDRGTMARRWQEGRDDADRTLQAAPWQVPAAPGTGMRTFDVTNPHRHRC